jgi:hypothetical protein
MAPDDAEDRVSIPLAPEDALQDVLTVDPDAEPAETEATPKQTHPAPKGAEDIYGETWIDRS